MRFVDPDVSERGYVHDTCTRYELTHHPSCKMIHYGASYKRICQKSYNDTKYVEPLKPSFKTKMTW